MCVGLYSMVSPYRIWACSKWGESLTFPQCASRLKVSANKESESDILLFSSWNTENILDVFIRTNYITKKKNTKK